MQIHIDFEGPLCICSTCIHHAATMLGWFIGNRDVSQDLRAAGRRNQVLRERIAKLEAQLANVTALKKEIADDLDRDGARTA